jgi:hypothetical protein
MPTLPKGVSQADFDTFVARYGVPPLIGGGSGEEGGGERGAADEGKGGSEGAGSGEGEEQDDAKNALKALAAERKRAEAAEKRLKEIEDRDKSELQKAQERAEAAEKAVADSTARMRELAAKDVIRDAALEAGGKRPAVIFELVKSKVAYGEDGSITNVKDVIAQAKKDAPELFGISSNGNPGAGAGGGESAGTDMNAAIRQAAGRSRK